MIQQKKFIDGLVCGVLTAMVLWAVASDPAAARLWCQGDCNVSAWPVEDCLRFKIQTPEKAFFTLEIDDDPPDQRGEFYQKFAGKSSSVAATLWETKFCGVKRDKVYYWVLRADVRDYGPRLAPNRHVKHNVTYKVGALWSNRRNLDLWLNEIRLNNVRDIDAVCECAFEVRPVPGDRIFQLGVPTRLSIADGQSIYPRLWKRFDNFNGDTLRLRIDASDRDDPSGFALGPGALSFDKVAVSDYLRIGLGKRKYDMRAANETLDVTMHFETNLYYYNNKTLPKEAEVNVFLASPRRLASGAGIPRLHQAAVPVINQPSENAGFCGTVTFQVDWNPNPNPSYPIVEGAFEFQKYKGNNPPCPLASDACWTPQVLSGYATFPPLPTINITRAEFPSKGRWRVRARSTPKAGRQSSPTPWRSFRVVFDVNCP